jgi:hypothetical protein
MKPDPECYVLHLAPIPDDRLKRAPLARLRALLKAAKRGYGLRATLVKPSTAKEDQP